VLEHLVIERQVGDQVLQTPILVFERAQLLRIAHIHPAVLRAPAIERGLADAVLANEIRHLLAGLGRLQDLDHLLFAKPTLPHRFLPAQLGED
jgi:hypothetical protein